MPKKPSQAQQALIKKQCSVCGKFDVDRCHIKTKGSGGTWDADNILFMCRQHHTEQHQIGWVKFLTKYPNIEWELNEKGWMVESLFGRVRLVRR